LSSRKDVLDLVAKAWRAFECSTVPPRVDPSIPVLFFGDLEAYCKSQLRVVTVGLNPSAKEFPKLPDASPFHRFPLAEDITPDERARYIDALSAYFCSNPYMGWFSAFEPMLCGMGASYYAGQPSTALHTDICSPVATDPTWNGLSRDEQESLKAKGVSLWHELLEALCPNVVAISIGKRHSSLIDVKALSECKSIHVFDKGAGGHLWKRPIPVRVRWYEVCNKPTLFVFIPAAQKPLAWLNNVQRCEAGKIALDEFRRGR